MKISTVLSMTLLLAAGAFAGSWETHTKLNAVEFDASSNCVLAFLDHSTDATTDFVYKYDWTAPGNSMDVAKSLMATLLTAYSSGTPAYVFYTSKAVPAAATWGTVGEMKSVRLAAPNYTGR